MKLHSKALIKELTPVFESAGFLSFKESGLKGFFVQKVSDGFYLCGAPIIHRFYDDKYTLDLYYANHLAMYASNYDMPYQSCIRIGDYLSERERFNHLGDSYADQWWSLYTKDDTINTEELMHLGQLLKLLIPRIIDNKVLATQIKNSKRAAALGKEEIETIAYFAENTFRSDLQYQPAPKNTRCSIPQEWFMAAEKIMANKDNGEENLIQAVSSLAKRSFCRHKADLAFIEKVACPYSPCVTDV